MPPPSNTDGKTDLTTAYFNSFLVQKRKQNLQNVLRQRLYDLARTTQESALYRLFSYPILQPANGHQIVQNRDEETLKDAAINQNIVNQISPIIAENCESKNIFREATAKDGATVSITVTSFEYSLFEMIGKNFKAYESLSVISNSCNEVLYYTIQADKNGKISNVGLAPAVLGESGGICHMDIIRENGSIHIKLPWGTECKKRN